MSTGTTTSKAMSLTRISRTGVRAATDGNKNTNATARRKSASSQVPEREIGRSLKGPDLGTG